MCKFRRKLSAAIMLRSKRTRIRIRSNQKLCSIILAVSLIFASVPMVLANDDGCTHGHNHNAACGYAEGVPCDHIHDGICGYVEAVLCGHVHDLICGWDNTTETGCGHNHDTACGFMDAVVCGHYHDTSCSYVMAQLCNYSHDNDCGGLSLGSSNNLATPTSLVIITMFNELAEEILFQGYDLANITSQDDLMLPDKLAGKDANDNAIVIENVKWESNPTFIPMGSTNFEFSPVLSNEYVIKDGTDVPLISVFIRPEGDIGIMPMSSPLTGSRGISTPQELQEIGKSLPLNGRYHLTRDIVLNAEWTPIGTGLNSSNGRDPSKAFVGTFDGQGYTISNLFIQESSTVVYAGLFGLVGDNATIMNIGVHVHDSFGIRSRIAHGDTANGDHRAYAGGLIGEVIGNNVRIENSYVRGGEIYSYSSCGSGHNARSYAGGLVGHVASGSLTIYRCYATNLITARSAVDKERYAGDLVGRSTSGTVSVQQSYSPTSQTVRTTTNGSSYSTDSEVYYEIPRPMQPWNPIRYLQGGSTIRGTRISTANISNESSYTGFFVAPNNTWIMDSSKNGGMPSLRVHVTGMTINKSQTALLLDDGSGNPGMEQLFASLSPQQYTRPTFLPSNIPTNKTIIWSSIHPTIATVNSDGVVTAVSAGSGVAYATIRATAADTSDGTFIADCVVKVTQYGEPVTGVSLSKSNTSIYIDEEEDLSKFIIFTPLEPSCQVVTWTSDNANVAKIDYDSGVVTGVSEGTTTIRGTTKDGGFTTTCTVNVTYAPVDSISINPPQPIGIGETRILTAEVRPLNANSAVTWSTLHPGIATIDPLTGLVTANAEGQAIIRATAADGGLFAECPVEVVIRVTGVSLNKSTANITVGDSEVLEATVTPNNATIKKITWESSIPSIAEVDEDGVVTGQTVGTAIITATTYDGDFTEECVVTVVPVSVTGVKLDKNTAEVSIDATETLVATVEPIDATDKGVTWESSDITKATVDNNGVITGVSLGDVTITVKTDEGGFTDECIVTVTDKIYAVDGVSVKNVSTILIGQTEHLIATISPSNATNKNITWESSDTSIATVDSNGVVTAVSSGTATITVKTEDGGFTADCIINSIDQYLQVIIDKDGTEAFTDADNSIHFTWTIIGSGNITQTVEVNGNPISLSGESITIPIATVSGFKDSYILKVTVTNDYGEQSSDDITIEVYSKNALASGLGTSITIDNKGSVEGKTSADILANRDGLVLSHDISFDTTHFPWSWQDSLTWEISDKNIADVQRLQQFGWVTVTPNEAVSPFSFMRIIGKEEGNTTLIVTHHRTGMTASIPVSIVTLEGKLFIIKTTPAQSFQISYSNGAGVSRNLDTSDTSIYGMRGAQGEIAIYEPSGINGNMMIESISGSDRWIGTVLNSGLRSGENQNGLYPVNSIRLTLMSNVTLFAVEPGGDYYQGTVQVSGGLYKNGIYVPSSEIKDMNISTDSSGRILVPLDTGSFGTLSATDKYMYVFEIRFLNGNYAPRIIEIDAFYDYREALRANEFTIFLFNWESERQAVTFLLDGKDITNEKRNITLTDSSSSSVLMAYAILPSAGALSSATVRGVDNIAANNQNYKITEGLPFLSDTYVEIRWDLNSNSVPAGSTKSYNIVFTYTDGTSRTEKIPYAISSTVGMSNKLNSAVNRIRSIPFNTDFDSHTYNADGGRKYNIFPHDINFRSPIVSSYDELNYTVYLDDVGNGDYKFHAAASRYIVLENESAYNSVKTRVRSYDPYIYYNMPGRFTPVAVPKENVDLDTYIEGIIRWNSHKQDYDIIIHDADMIGKKTTNDKYVLEKDENGTWRLVLSSVSPGATAIKFVATGSTFGPAGFVVGFLASCVVSIAFPDKYLINNFDTLSEPSMHVESEHQINLSLETSTDERLVNRTSYSVPLLGMIPGFPTIDSNDLIQRNYNFWKSQSRYSFRDGLISATGDLKHDKWTYEQVINPNWDKRTTVGGVPPYINIVNNYKENVTLWSQHPLFASYASTRANFDSSIMFTVMDNMQVPYSLISAQASSFTTSSDIPGSDLGSVVSGDNTFAVSAWQDISKDVSIGYLENLVASGEITIEELVSLMNQMEISVSVYNGASWSSPLSLSNKQPVSYPVVSVDTVNKTAVVVWPSVIMRENSMGGHNILVELWYSTFKGDNWSEPKRIDFLGGNCLTGYQVAINDNGFAVIAGVGDADSEINDVVVYFVDANDKVTKTVATNSNATHANPQIVATDNDFHLAWHKFSGGKSDIIVGRLFANGAVDRNSTMSIADVSGIGNMNPSVQFKLVNGLGAQSAILCHTYDNESNGDTIYAVKLSDSGVLSLSAPMIIVPANENSMVEIIDGELNGNSVSLLYAEYTNAYSSGGNVAGIVRTESATFENSFLGNAVFEDLDVTFNGNLQVSFGVANTGIDNISSVEISINGSTLVTSGNIIKPGAVSQFDATLALGNTISNLPFSITVRFSNNETLTIDDYLILEKPDISIGKITTLIEEKGEREFSIHLFNDSDVKLENSNYEIRLSFYEDSMCENPIIVDGVTSISSQDNLRLLDKEGLNLNYRYTIPNHKLDNGEIPDTGIWIYIQAEIWDGATLVKQKSYLANKSAFGANSLVRYGEPVVTVTADTQNGLSGATANLYISNRSMQSVSASSGKIIATLYDASGNTVEVQTVPLANTLLKEDTASQMVQFSKNGLYVFAVYDGDTGGGGGSGGGGGGSSGGSSGSGGIGGDSDNESSRRSSSSSGNFIADLFAPSEKWLDKAEATKLVQNAKKTEQEYIRTKHNAKYGVRKDAWAVMKGYRYEHDTMDGRTILARLYIYQPELLNKDSYVSVWAKGQAVDVVRHNFGRWFTNKIQVIHFDRIELWGQEVKVAARVDLTDMDKDNLYFYAYDKAANKYKRFKTQYRIDDKGFLHFKTVFAGDIIISDGPLVKKSQANVSTETLLYVASNEIFAETIPVDVDDISMIGNDNPGTGGNPFAGFDTSNTIQLDGITVVDEWGFSINPFPAIKDTVSDMHPMTIIGLSVAALMLLIILWVAVPRKDDEYVTVEEYRKQNK